MRSRELEVMYADLETLKEYFLGSFYSPIEEKWYEFSVNRWENQLDDMIKFLENNKEVYFVFYNGVKFDCQVLEYIKRKHEKWVDKSNLEITMIIWKCAQEVISLTNADLFPPYKEVELSTKCIDVLEIPHFSNKARRTSLKWLEFMMDLENIEEMPIHHAKENLTKEEVALIKSYCRNDIMAVERWYKYITGEVPHEFYKGKNKIKDRLDLIERLSFPDYAISWSDVRIGDEINKKEYLKLTGKTVAELYELKRARGKTKKFTFGDCIPEYVSFKSFELNEFKKRISKEIVSLKDGDKQEFPLEFRGTKYIIARGGIHSVDSHRVIRPLGNELLRDADIGSQYPNSIIKRVLYPSHLGPEWLVGYKNSVKEKDKYKQLGKGGDLAAKGLEGLFKLALNGGGFGKTNERNSWQYDPRVTYYCTIGNQFEILMLIEMLELSGIHVISANTDGILCLLKKEEEGIYKEVCSQWEKVVGNHEMGKLEFTDFTIFAQENINNYIAVKEGGEVKIKGRFNYQDELNKNNTKDIGRIERKAIVEYFNKGTPAEETINSCEDIFQFCIGMKGSRNYHFESVRGASQVTKHKRVIRFFVSEKGEKLFKVKNEGVESNGADVTKIVEGHRVTMFNKANAHAIHGVDKAFYIKRCKDVISKIEERRKNKKYAEPPKEQISIF